MRSDSGMVDLPSPPLLFLFTVSISLGLYLFYSKKKKQKKPTGKSKDSAEMYKTFIIFPHMHKKGILYHPRLHKNKQQIMSRVQDSLKITVEKSKRKKKVLMRGVAVLLLLRFKSIRLFRNYSLSQVINNTSSKLSNRIQWEGSKLSLGRHVLILHDIQVNLPSATAIITNIHTVASLPWVTKRVVVFCIQSISLLNTFIL